MRQIKFRGKCQRGYDYSDGDGWIYGSLLQKDKVYAIVKTEDIDLSPNTDDGYSFVEDFGCIPVLPDTVSQFTGLVDRNGKEIYEEDIIEDKNGIGVIMWFQTAWGVASYAHGYNGVKSYTAVDSFYCNEVKEWAVIGNIHDNPELLNENQ